MKKRPTNKLILVVEDEITKRVALRFQLRALGAVEEAKSENEALSRIAEFRAREEGPRLAVIDLRLPGISGINPDGGFHVIEELGRLFPGAPVIILTVRNDADAWRKAKKLSNVRYFFTKPWASDGLRKAARTCLSGRAKGLECIGQVEGIRHE